jgi:hypothetical protein
VRHDALRDINGATGLQERSKRGSYGKETLALMAYIASREETTFNEAYTYRAEMGKTNPDALRSALSKLVNKGFLRRLRKGVFRMTPAGAKEFGIEYRGSLLHEEA